VLTPFFGELIQAAVGSTGDFGATPLKRIGWAANAASSMMARCLVSAASDPRPPRADEVIE
jgi:hypothetical protein